MKVTSLEAGRDWNWRRAKGGGGGIRADWDVWICDGEGGKGDGESRVTLTDEVQGLRVRWMKR